MTSYLIDVNLWIAMTWDQHRHHREARKWMNSKPEARFLFCGFTMFGFFRLLTKPGLSSLLCGLLSCFRYDSAGL